MELVKEGMNYMKGYQHVADFQRYCGVEIVEVDEVAENGFTDKASNGLEESAENNVPNSSAKHRAVNGHRNGFKNGIQNPNSKEAKLAYKINNKVIFHILEFGASLGSEMFYIVFFPFMIWNVDSRLTRQLLLIWYPLMYFGQFLKDWIQWPRPGPPAVRLEGNRFEMEYGMPSTHTIVGTCIPFSLLVLTSKYYEVYFDIFVEYLVRPFKI